MTSIADLIAEVARLRAALVEVTYYGDRAAVRIAEAALAEPVSKPKRIDWSNVVVDEGDEAP